MQKKTLSLEQDTADANDVHKIKPVRIPAWMRVGVEWGVGNSKGPTPLLEGEERVIFL